MIFQEKKLENGFEYIVEDVFGKITLTAISQIEPKMLDKVVMVVLEHHKKKLVINGDIYATFEPANAWLKDEEEEEGARLKDENVL